MATTDNRAVDRADAAVEPPPARRRRGWDSGTAAEQPVDELMASQAAAARRVSRAAPETDAGMEGAARLAQSIAHEFNNLLATVLGNLQFLQRRAGPDADIQRIIGPAIHAALRGSDLAKRLLAFAHRRELEPRPVDVNAAVTAMEAAIRRTAGPDIALTIGLADGRSSMATDVGRLESAIQSLVANARDAMAGGGKVTIEIAEAVIDATTAARSPTLTAGTYVCVAVGDTGCGMAPDLIDRAFEPFFSTKSPHIASGLGLSLVSDFVKRSGGHLTVRSTPGRGSRVCMFLPATERSPARAPKRGDAVA